MLFEEVIAVPQAASAVFNPIFLWKPSTVCGPASLPLLRYEPLGQSPPTHVKYFYF